MTLEENKHDLDLQILALKAFENTVGSSGEFESDTLSGLLEIFHIIWPLYKECLKSPPPNTSSRMLDCLKAMDDQLSGNRTPEDIPRPQGSDDVDPVSGTGAEE